MEDHAHVIETGNRGRIYNPPPSCINQKRTLILAFLLFLLPFPAFSEQQNSPGISTSGTSASKNNSPSSASKSPRLGRWSSFGGNVQAMPDVESDPRPIATQGAAVQQQGVTKAKPGQRVKRVKRLRNKNYFRKKVEARKNVSREKKMSRGEARSMRRIKNKRPNPFGSDRVIIRGRRIPQ